MSRLLVLLLLFLGACSLDRTGLDQTVPITQLRGSVDAGRPVAEDSGSGGGPDTRVIDTNPIPADTQLNSSDGGSETVPGDAGADTRLSPSECPIDSARSLQWCDGIVQVCHYGPAIMTGCIAEGHLCVAVCP